MNTIGVALTTGLIGLFSYILGRVFERRKHVAETEGKELDNVSKAIAIWRDTALELKKDVEKLNQQVYALIEENKALRIKIGHFEKAIEKINH